MRLVRIERPPPRNPLKTGAFLVVATLALTIVASAIIVSATKVAIMSIYDPATYDIRTAVPPMLARVRQAFLAELEERLAPFDLKAADYLVLVALANDAADTASSVCSVLAHDPGAMTRKIDA